MHDILIVKGSSAAVKVRNAGFVRIGPKHTL